MKSYLILYGIVKVKYGNQTFYQEIEFLKDLVIILIVNLQVVFPLLSPFGFDSQE